MESKSLPLNNIRAKEKEREEAKIKINNDDMKRSSSIEREKRRKNCIIQYLNNLHR